MLCFGPMVKSCGLLRNIDGKQSCYKSCFRKSWEAILCRRHELPEIRLLYRAICESRIQGQDGDGLHWQDFTSV